MRDADPRLPKGGKVVKAQRLGLSDWCDTTRYDVELPDGTIKSFFEKVCQQWAFVLTLGLWG